MAVNYWLKAPFTQDLGQPAQRRSIPAAVSRHRQVRIGTAHAPLRVTSDRACDTESRTSEAKPREEMVTVAPCARRPGDLTYQGPAVI